MGERRRLADDMVGVPRWGRLLAGLTHEQVMSTIGLYGTQVIPRVRELVDHAPESVAGAS